MSNKQCRKCGVVLIVVRNWHRSQAARNSKLCKTCGYEAKKLSLSRNAAHYRAYRVKWDRANPHRVIFRTKKNHAKALGIPFNLRLEDMKWPTHCPVLGLKLQYDRHKNRSVRPNSPSFDRINPKKGYVNGNVIIVSQRVNSIKQDASPEEIIKVGRFFARGVQR